MKTDHGGTVALSWGRFGGFYVHRTRVCLGRLALTYVPVEIDDLMRAYADAGFSEVCWQGNHDACMLAGCACDCHGAGEDGCPKCGRPSADPPAEVYCIECATEGWQEDAAAWRAHRAASDEERAQ